MGLIIQYNTAKDLRSGTKYPFSWQVQSSHLNNKAFLIGFARKKDAEIAVRAMLELPIDWDADIDTLREQWRSYGASTAVMRYVCERLQW